MKRLSFVFLCLALQLPLTFAQAKPPSADAFQKRYDELEAAHETLVSDVLWNNVAAMLRAVLMTGVGPGFVLDLKGKDFGNELYAADAKGTVCRITKERGLFGVNSTGKRMNAGAMDEYGQITCLTANARLAFGPASFSMTDWRGQVATHVGPNYDKQATFGTQRDSDGRILQIYPK